MATAGMELMVRPKPEEIAATAEEAIVVKELGLLYYDRMVRAIAEAHDVDEVKRIHDKAARVQAYLRQFRNTEAECKVRKIRYRAEREIGKLLRAEELSKGGRPTKTGTQTELVKTLAERGISRKLSSRSQRLAEMSEEVFESYMKTFDGLAEYERLRVVAFLAYRDGKWWVPGVGPDAPFSAVKELNEPEDGWWWKKYWSERPQGKTRLDFTVEMRFLYTEDIYEFFKLIGESVPEPFETNHFAVLFKATLIDQLTGRRITRADQRSTMT